jgi:antitoxin ParD1/3/4
MPTSVALSPHFETFVKEQVSTGRFNNVSEVVRAGLRLLEDQEQMKALKLQELRTAIQAGAASGPGVDAEQVFERLERKYKTAANKEAVKAAN